MRQTNEKLRHRRKAFWWLKIKKGERKIKNHQGGEKTKQNQMNIKVLARFHPVGLCWVTVWWAQPVSETVPGSQQTTPKLNKHSKQAVLLPFHWSTKWGTWRRPCLKWHNLKTVESKFRAAWASLQSLTDCASFSSTAHRERVSTGGLRRRQNSSNACNPLLSWEDPSLRFGVPALRAR